MDFIPLRDILRAFRDGLSDSSELEAFCLNNFGKAPAIFIGYDLQNPPGKEDCPLVIVTPSAADEGPELDSFAYRIKVDWGIVQSGGPDKSGQVTEYGGIYTLDEMGGHIWDALTKSTDAVVLGQREYTLEAVEFFPMLVGGFEITITLPNTIGGSVTL
jgi:hypothetical protein